MNYTTLEPYDFLQNGLSNAVYGTAAIYGITWIGIVSPKNAELFLRKT
jgi:hypothetical protein